MLAFFRHSFALHIRAQRGAASGERSDDDGGSDDGGSDDGDDGMEIDAACDARQVEDGIRTACAKLHDVGLLPYAARIHWPLLRAPRVAAGAVAASSDADALRAFAPILAHSVFAHHRCARECLSQMMHTAIRERVGKVARGKFEAQTLPAIRAWTAAVADSWLPLIFLPQVGRQALQALCGAGVAWLGLAWLGLAAPRRLARG